VEFPVFVTTHLALGRGESHEMTGVHESEWLIGRRGVDDGLFSRGIPDNIDGSGNNRDSRDSRDSRGAAAREEPDPDGKGGNGDKPPNGDKGDF
jgi:hypothetical protein